MADNNEPKVSSAGMVRGVLILLLFLLFMYALFFMSGDAL